MSFRPLLAYTVKDVEQLEFPVYASVKLDGIRCVIHDDQPVSRSLKPIPNRFIQEQLAFYPPFDGELLVGDPRDPRAFNKSTSGIMSHDGEPDFTYWVFDWAEPRDASSGFEYRIAHAKSHCESGRWPRVKWVTHELVEDVESLIKLEQLAIGFGYEGIMVRSPSGPYKHGRSTANQGFLGKVKRFEDTEGEIVGVEELMHNDNEQETNLLGYAERSHAKSGQRPGGTLGALIVRHPSYEQTFGIGTGFTAEDRLTMWLERDNLIGQVVKFKHQPSGAKDLPRFPVFLGLRKD